MTQNANSVDNLCADIRPFVDYCKIIMQHDNAKSMIITKMYIIVPNSPVGRRINNHLVHALLSRKRYIVRH